MKNFQYSLVILSLFFVTACVDKEREQAARIGAGSQSDPLDAKQDLAAIDSDFVVNGVGFDLPGEYKLVYERDEMKGSISLRKIFVESKERKAEEVRSDLISASESKGCSLRKEVSGENRASLDFSCPFGRFSALVRSRNAHGQPVNSAAVFGIIQISYRLGE